MVTHKELIAIVVVSIIIAFASTLLSSTNAFLVVFLIIFAIILINSFAKKTIAYYFDTEVEVKIWEFKRWGYKPHQYFKKGIPAGAFLPIISKIIFFPIAGFVWMASMVFEVKAKTYRAAKRHGIYSFSDVSGDHIAYIAAAGLFSNLLFALLAYLIGLQEFAKLSIWFAFFNIIPISDLDGNKIFFGSKVLWSFLATIILIATLVTFFVI